MLLFDSSQVLVPLFSILALDCIMIRPIQKLQGSFSPPMTFLQMVITCCLHLCRKSFYLIWTHHHLKGSAKLWMSCMKLVTCWSTGKSRNFERWLTNKMTLKKLKVKSASRHRDESRLKTSRNSKSNQLTCRAMILPFLLRCDKIQFKK